MTTTTTAYTTYREAQQSVLDGKELVKVLWKELEQAGQKARRETVGAFDEKMIAVRAAVEPYKMQIAQLETEIAKQYEIADSNFDAWQGLNQ